MSNCHKYEYRFDKAAEHGDDVCLRRYDPWFDGKRLYDSPQRRWLEAQIGRPWSNVNSEYRKKFGTSHRSLRLLDWYVTFCDEPQFCRNGIIGWRMHGIWIDNAGICRGYNKKTHKWKTPPRQDRKQIQNRYLQKWRGVWWDCEVLEKSKTTFKDRYVDYYHLPVWAWSPDLMIIKRHQLSGETTKHLGLS